MRANLGDEVVYIRGDGAFPCGRVVEVEDRLGVQAYRVFSGAGIEWVDAFDIISVLIPVKA